MMAVTLSFGEAADSAVTDFDFFINVERRIPFWSLDEKTMRMRRILTLLGLRTEKRLCLFTP